MVYQRSTNEDEAYERGRLLARPSAQPKPMLVVGQQRLGIAAPRDGVIYVPKAARSGEPVPVLLALHGAGGNAQQGAVIVSKLAQVAGVIIVVPDSRHQTWDVIHGGYGPDVLFIDQALQQIFSQYAIDSQRIGISGFSDGASYALSLGLSNGDMFTHIIACSPGFIAPVEPTGQPRICITHGTRDQVLPIDRCSRRIVPQLRHQGYDVRYREFNGSHVLHLRATYAALRWFVSRLPAP